MITPLLRKFDQAWKDPVLRRWLFGVALKRWPGAPAYAVHRPPYLEDLLPLSPEPANADFTESSLAAPEKGIRLELAGKTLNLEPGDEHGLFEQEFDDLETLLSLHRFAWLPALAEDADPAWVRAIWTTWCEAFGTPDNSWAWHPYTVAERAINILSHGRSNGLPGPVKDTVSLLARHALVIAKKLEYFGDQHTSNHLANNGRGLFLIGLWLGLPKSAGLGGAILIHEAARIFAPSGMLREGSSHYHMLLANRYDQVRREADRYNRVETTVLSEIAEKARAVSSALLLPGGMPLVGDISPDCTPQYLLDGFSNTGPDRGLNGDGWLRFDSAPWAGLWHAAPEGWSHMPGHGHQDMGSFELHYKVNPVFVDPGRGCYGEDDDAAFYRGAGAHSGVSVDGFDPYPANRPYYSDIFRREVGGPAPVLSKSTNTVTLIHYGFGRISGAGKHQRQWHFDGSRLTIRDKLSGHGSHRVVRNLMTPMSPELYDGGVILCGSSDRYRISGGEADITISPITRWLAYGYGTPAHMISLTDYSKFPFESDIEVVRL